MKIEYRIIGVETLRSETKHIACFGASGMGKGTFMESYLSKCPGKRVDCFSLERQEGMCYSIPADEDYDNPNSFSKLGKIYTNGQWRPQSFENDIYAFYGKKFRSKDYPTIPANIKLVTLRKDSLDNDDYVNLFGTTKSSKQLILQIVSYWERYHKDPTHRLTLKEIYRVVEFIQSKIPDKGLKGAEKVFKSAHGSTAYVIKRAIDGFERSGLFNKNFPKFDPSKFINEDGIITTISQTFLDTTQERAIAVGLMLKNICEYQKNRKNKKDLFLYFRELKVLFDKTESGEDYWRLAKYYVSYILTEGRDNKLWILADCQMTDQLADYISMHFHKVFSFRQSEKGLKKLKQYSFIDSYTLKKMQSIDKFMGIAIINGHYAYPVHIITPTFKKKRGGEDIFPILEAKYGKKDVKELLIKYKVDDVENDLVENIFVEDSNNNILISNSTNKNEVEDENETQI